MDVIALNTSGSHSTYRTFKAVLLYMLNKSEYHSVFDESEDLFVELELPVDLRLAKVETLLRWEPYAHSTNE